MGQKRYALASALVMILALALAIFSMASQGWYLLPGDPEVTFHVGLKTWTATKDGVPDWHGNNNDGTLRGFDFDGAGNIILGTGIVGLLALVVGVGCLVVGKCRSRPNLTLAGITCFYITGALVTLGVVLYAKKTKLDYSFILFTFSGFLFLVAATIAVIAHSSDDEQTGMKGTRSSSTGSMSNRA